MKCVSLVLSLSACSGSDAGQRAESASATPSTPAAPDAAEYTMVLRSSWTQATHPFEYPPASPTGGPHFSGVVGATHTLSYAMFTEGARPTPGLETLSEEGTQTPLDAEVRAAIATGSAGTLFTTEPLRDLRDSVTATFRVDAAHPLVTIVAKIAPSPDWFAGVRNVELRENGQWVSSKTVDLHAWDSGGDDGETYRAADKDANPKKFTAMARSRHFVTNRIAVPVATVTFTKK